MAELAPRERLQPSLLDRLTDDDPARRQEPRERRVLSPERLRESVRRDLSWLFNTTCLTAVEDLSAFPEVERSTLNYGLPDLAGRTVSSIDLPGLERALKRAIWDFEPRLIKSSVRVKLSISRDQMNSKALCFSIDADLWCQPIPLRLYLRTELDLETGEVKVSEVSGAGSR